MNDPDVKVVLVDEAELVLLMFEYLTARDDADRPEGSAREVLDKIETLIDAARHVPDKTALMISTDLTKLALRWICEKSNAAHPGTMRNLSEETRQ